jgi:hypothetical protein
LFTPAGLPEVAPAIVAPDSPAADRTSPEPSFLFPASPKTLRKSRAKPKPAPIQSDLEPKPEPQPADAPMAKARRRTAGKPASDVADDS